MENSENQPSVLEYARFHKISHDYSSQPLWSPATLSVWAIEVHANTTDLEDISDLQAMARIREEERLELTRQEALLLKDAMVLPQLADPMERILAQRQRRQQMRVELPLLRSDHDLDMMHFTKRSSIDFSNVNFPLEHVDEENDEGIGWPSKFLTLPAEKQLEIDTEKLEITRESLLYLRDVTMAATLGAADLEEVKHEITYKRNPALDPVTPPLLPLSPPYTPYMPASPVAHLELTSTPTDPTIAELQAVEAHINEQDSILPNGIARSQPLDFDTDTIGQVYSPLKDIGKAPSSPTAKRKRAEDFMVEGPITPPMSLQSPLKKAKSVPLADYLREFVPLNLDLQPISGLPKSEDDHDMFFDDVVAPIAETVDKTMEQEKLIEADATMRVDVPQMDFTLPRPPWTTRTGKNISEKKSRDPSSSAQQGLLSMTKHEHFKQNRHWPGVSKLELKLPWTPFPMHLARVAAEEKFDDGSLERYMAGLAFDTSVDTEILVWKPDGLRILDPQEDDDEDLEPADFEEEHMSIEMLVRKRRSEFDEHMTTGEEAHGDPAPLSKNEPQVGGTEPQPVPEIGAPVATATTDDSGEPDNSVMFGGLFSVTSALSNFIGVRSGLVAKPTSKRSAAAGATLLPVTSETPKSLPAVLMTAPEAEARLLASTLTARTRPTPLPSLATPLRPRPFVVSSNMLRHRSLMRRIRELYPSADMIERDFTSRCAAIPQPKEQRAGPDHLEEADILLSPGTSLVVTSLQKIKQKRLPGQAAVSGFRERVLQITPRYECLIVLVGQDGHGDDQAIDERDCDALRELVGFAELIDAGVVVTFVSGGEEQLATWIVAAMAKYGVSEEQKLLQDETLWELFLRHAGMNAFAAQTVLAELKERVPSPGTETSSAEDIGDSLPAFGLAAFVKMSADERVRKFERLLGGRRMLNRVSKALDAT
ncbi:structural constituent of nuclear pore [Elasticomyces elasticus]|nr:structural constituent of nuclear pore [Elasticomyces elasticus]